MLHLSSQDSLGLDEFTERARLKELLKVKKDDRRKGDLSQSATEAQKSFMNFD